MKRRNIFGRFYLNISHKRCNMLNLEKIFYFCLVDKFINFQCLFRISIRVDIIDIYFGYFSLFFWCTSFNYIYTPHKTVCFILGRPKKFLHLLKEPNFFSDLNRSICFWENWTKKIPYSRDNRLYETQLNLNWLLRNIQLSQ